MCGEAEDAVTAMQSIGELQPDIAVVDITLKDTYGIELIKALEESARATFRCWCCRCTMSRCMGSVRSAGGEGVSEQAGGEQESGRGDPHDPVGGNLRERQDEGGHPAEDVGG